MSPWIDLMEAFPEAEENLGELEDLFIYLSEEGIQVLYGDEKKEPEEAAEEAEPEPEELKEAEVADPIESSYDAHLSEIASDDTISLYLKEMARVPLLTAEQEVILARQLRGGAQGAAKLAQNAALSEDEQGSPLHRWSSAAKARARI